MGLHAATDSDLFCAFRDQGDRAALSLLFERHRSLAYRVALGVLGSPPDAEDAAQDAFLRLIRSAPRLHAEASLAGMVAHMALRSAQDLARASGRRRAHEMAAAQCADAAAPSALDALEEQEQRRAVRAAVESLGETYRLPVALHYLHGLSTLETAQALGISHAAARTRLSRALTRLRQHLQRDGILLAAPALAALLEPSAVQAAPATLAARLEGLAAGITPSAPASAGLMAVGGGALGAKLAAAGVVVAVSLGGMGVPRRLPPPPHASAGNLLRLTASRSDPAVRRGSARATDKTAARGSRDGRASFLPPLPGLRTARPAVPGPSAASGSSGMAQTRPGADPSQVAAAAGERVDPPAANARWQPGRKLSPDEERQLAIEIIVEAWEESEKAGYEAREEVLAPLAMADPAQAHALAAGLPANLQQKAREMIFVGLLRSDPQQALARVNDLRPGLGLTVNLLGPLARGRAPAAAPLLDYAIATFEQLPAGQADLAEQARLAAIAARLGDARAPALLAAAKQRVAEIQQQQPAARPAPWVLFPIAAALAGADPDAALGLSELLPAGPRGEVWKRVVGIVAAQDPVRAVRLLDARPLAPGASPDEVLNWSSAARQTVRALAMRDAAAAETLARRIPSACLRALALGEVAHRLTGRGAAALYGEALKVANDPDQEGLSREWVFASLLDTAPSDTERRAAAADLLALGGAYAGWAAHAAYALARTDPEQARWILDDALENRESASEVPARPVTGPPAETPARSYLAVAFAAIDPVRAVEIARGLPPRSPWRFDAMRHIAGFLLASPEQRSAARFDTWRANVTTDPEEAVR